MSRLYLVTIDVAEDSRVSQVARNTGEVRHLCALAEDMGATVIKVERVSASLLAWSAAFTEDEMDYATDDQIVDAYNAHEGALEVVVPNGLRVTYRHRRSYSAPRRQFTSRRVVRVWPLEAATLDAGGGSTLAMLYRSDTVVSTGFARCHPGDQFCKRTGRAIALRRAVANLPERTSPT